MEELDDQVAGLLEDAGPTRPSQITILGSRTGAVRIFDPERAAAAFTLIRRTDLYLESRSAFLAVGGDLPCDVVLIFGFDGTRSPLLEVRLLTRPDTSMPINSTRIRTIPLDLLAKKAIIERRVIYRKTAPDTFEAADLPGFEEDRDARSRYVAKMKAASLRSRISDEQLAKAADSYRLAVMAGRNPTAAVESAMGLPNRNTAKKWVQKARRTGFLEPAPGERVGGLSQ
jgi:hypothetical protein